MFSHTREFVRQRAARIVDPYDPDSSVDDWGDPDKIEISGYLDSQSSVEQVDASRAQVVSLTQLIVDDPGADVQRGDRIVKGGRVWVVTGFPSDDVNPFTGWQPTLVCNLEEVQG